MPGARDEAVLEKVRATGNFTLVLDPTIEQLRSEIGRADVVYTDTWVDMEVIHDPNERDEVERRKRLMMPFQINRENYGSSHALVMHCMPLHVGYEIEGAMVDHPRSVIFRQAENRTHGQSAILLHLLAGLRARNAGVAGHTRKLARSGAQLSHHPRRRVFRQVGDLLEELLDVLADHAGSEVLAQELVVVAGDALAQQAAAAQRRDDEALHRAEAAASSAGRASARRAPCCRQVEQLDRIDADLGPDLQDRGEAASAGCAGRSACAPPRGRSPRARCAARRSGSGTQRSTYCTP